MLNFQKMDLKRISIFLIPIFVLACAEPTTTQDEPNDLEEQLEQKAQEPIQEQREKAYYPIPSPEQMFGFINDNGISYTKSLLNDVANRESYLTPSAKALNFGVYTADLAYSSAYQDIESTIELYKVVKMMGADLNIQEMMTEEMMSNMQENLQNKDSLAVIAGQSYYQAVEFLERNNESDKLALMSLGGWVESMYITINSIEKYEAESATIQRIADQKVTFGNLYTYLKKNDALSDGIKVELENIQAIRSVFAGLQESKPVKSKKDKKGGKMILGGGTRITMNQEQFSALKKAINDYRTRIVNK
ncbi:MAG: hypothetical protein D8M25_12970 [Bacteroidetes bacterium]|nr:hypothetical protein [Bacteroidota bacterium]